MCALIFLYREVLGDPLPWTHDLVRARRPERVPVVMGPRVVMSAEEVRERMTMLPAVTVAALQEQLAEARMVHQSDVAAGFGAVWLPDAFERKFPAAARDWRWQSVFPATSTAWGQVSHVRSAPNAPHEDPPTVETPMTANIEDLVPTCPHACPV